MDSDNQSETAPTRKRGGRRRQKHNPVDIDIAIAIAPTTMPLRKLLVISIGNPPPLLNTLHSAGHTVLQALWRALSYPPFRPAPRGLVSSAPELPFVLWRSASFMNESGVGVRRVVMRGGEEEGAAAAAAAEAADVVVLHDELELGLGKVKVRKGGSARGHNGIKSILAHLPPERHGFTRIAVGIGRPASRASEDVSAYVLRKMTPAEKRVLEEEAAPEVLRVLRELALEP